MEELTSSADVIWSEYEAAHIGSVKKIPNQTHKKA